MCSNRSSLHIQTWSFIAPQDALYLFALPQGVSSSTLDSDLTVKAKEASFCMIEKTALCLACMYLVVVAASMLLEVHTNIWLH